MTLMASALIHMSSLSLCTQLGENIMMLDMETELESLSRDGEGTESRLKRSNQEADDDQERSHVKKRRKQSKPVRITSSDPVNEHVDFMQGVQALEYTGVVNHFLTNTLLEESLQNFSSSEDLDESDVFKTTDEQNEIQSSVKEIEETAFPLNLSSIKPSTSFGDSIMSSQMIDNTSKFSKQQTALDVSLFAYQSSSSSPEGTPRKMTPQDKMFLSSPTLLLPFVKQNQMPNSNPQGGSPLRIFNPEAFCDLCNKEFCNKYFLKTHKANKHGIYNDNIGGPTILDTLPSLPFMNYFPNNCDTPNQTLPRTINVVKKPQGPQTSNLVQLKTNINTGNGSMRAFCNICQREFCNKYFVRRHKAKIHGIFDPTMKDGFGFEGQEFKNPGNTIPINSTEKSESSINDNEMLIGHANSFYFGGEKSDIQNTELNTEGVVIKQENENETENEGCIETSMIPASIPASVSSSLQISQNEDGIRDGNLSPDRLKRISFVNTDAFCDICCKEYCNKYFLRTHKLKCHGITPMDLDKKEDKINGNSIGQTYYSIQSQIQTVPLNLIVGDQGTNSLETAARAQYDNESEDQITCNECGRYFQNQVLLKMHVSTAHTNKDFQSYINHSGTKENKDCEKMFKSTRSEKTISETATERPTQNTNIESNKNMSFDSIQKLHSMIVKLSSSNTSENSVCEVCNKDIGQPSLLETHILKEHSNLLEEIGSVFDEDNSNSQSSFIVPTYGTKNDCTYCQKSFSSSVLLEHHLSECHTEPDQINIPSSPAVSKSLKKENNDSLKCSTVNLLTPQSERQGGVQTPTSSFCEICKKELCNKYFMKTHMQRMHGISIENGAHIGGVVCDICNKELCSKYFLRVHKQNSHGIVDEVFLPQLTVEGIRNQSPNADIALKPSEQTDLSHRYFSHFTEVCMICSRRFRSTKWLKAHLLNDHGEEGKDKWKEFQIQLDITSKIEKPSKEGIKKPDQSSMTSFCGSVYKPTTSSNINVSLSEANTVRYDTLTRPSSVEKLHQTNMFAMLLSEKDQTAKQYQCSYCSFSTPILAFLFVHERSHMRNSAICRTDQESTYKCSICLQIYDTKESLDKHLLSHKKTGVMPYTTESFSSTQDFVKHFQTVSKNEYDFLNGKEVLTEGKAENIIQNENEVAQISEENKLKKDKNSTIRETHDENYPNVLAVTSKTSDENNYKCTKCDFTYTDINVYNDHIITEHKNNDEIFLSQGQRMNSELVGTLEKVKNCLSLIASKAEIPALYAVPQTQCQYTMQPFVLEDSSDHKETSSTSLESKLGKSFLSSLVFLPVREMLKKPVTASFKLTPT